MKSRILCIVKYPAVFIAAFLFLLLFTISAAYISKEKIKPKMYESAEYMCENKTSFLLVNWLQASKIDHYADCLTLSIAHQLNEKKPIESALWASFYGDSSSKMNEYLLESVREDLPANHEYLRYWHGSAMAMRFLHLFWNVETIYAFHTILMILLGAILILLLVKNGYCGEAVSFALAMFTVSVWYVPLCLEYTYCFLCMLVSSIIGINLALKGKDAWIGPFFLITGMVTNYFDFLTCETLSLLVPLLLIFGIQKNKKNSVYLWKSTIKFFVAWGIGYLGMWVMKWATAALVLRINVIPYVKGHIGERLNSIVSGYGITGNPIYDAIVLNLKKMIPYEYGIYGAVGLMIALALFVVLPVYKGKIVLRKKIQVSSCLLFVLLGLVPYIRYMILRNHSIIHSFFTYRAQAATVLALCFIILELVKPVKRKLVTGHET